MVYEAAPLEGITDYIWRQIHARFYPGADGYWTPFLSVTQGFSLTGRALKEVTGSPLPLTVQLLTADGEDFLSAARLLAGRGFREVNLNAGCPSGTVTAKGKGSGLLRTPERLDALLDRIFSASPAAVSVKTRIGWQDPAEWPALLEIYNRYPLSRLVVHARTKGEMYTGTAHREVYAYTLSRSRAPVYLSGDITSPADCRELEAEFPNLAGVLLGRGLAADPGLLARCQGREDGGKSRLREFHDALYAAYQTGFADPRSAMMRMKELWSYLITRFDGGEEYAPKLARAKTPTEFAGLADTVLRTLALK